MDPDRGILEIKLRTRKPRKNENMFASAILQVYSTFADFLLLYFERVVKNWFISV